MKNLIVVFVGLWLATSCDVQPHLHEIRGNTMGTTYSIVYAGKKQESLKSLVDSLLRDVNQSLSTYIPTSTISRVNRANRAAWIDGRFQLNLDQSIQIWKRTAGAFDPSVMPLVNAWGFGFKDMEMEVDSALIDSLMQYVGLDKVAVFQDSLYKVAPGVMLDFSAIAKGYGVDEVASLLKAQGYQDFIVEIGGEVYASGSKGPGINWVIGIEKPIYDAMGLNRELETTVPLANKGMATSGDYRNYYIKDGKKFAHVIDPKTGYPANSNVLSATVIAENCMIADALATSLMIMGVKDAMKMAMNDTSIAVFLIYSAESGEIEHFASENLQGVLGTAY